MKFRITVDLGKALTSTQHRDVFGQYLRGQIKGYQAAREMGISQHTWEKLVASLVSVATSGICGCSVEEVRE